MISGDDIEAMIGMEYWTREKDDGWRGIETAPQNIEIVATDGMFVFCGIIKVFSSVPKGRFHYLDQSGTYAHPTHWQPLPAPPKVT
jgi:hypothetical protein